MYVQVDPQGLRLRATEEMNSFFIQVTDMSLEPERLERLLGDAGVLDGDHVYVSVAWLRANGEQTDVWQEKLAQMLRYADGQGWLNASGVRAHIEQASRITTYDPESGETIALDIWETTPGVVNDLASTARQAAPALEGMGRDGRARILRFMARALESNRAEIVRLAVRETAIGSSRLDAELTRTTYQMEVFAGVLEDGGYLEATIDHAGDTPMGPRPDLRRMLVPLGPVAVFGASNFPLAFSVAGGDTVSAIAAGCPVVVKAHSSHPMLSSLVGRLLQEAASAAGAPSGTVSLVFGRAAGMSLVHHDAIAAVGFTGSLSGAEALQRVIANRTRPIPFFGELSSLNPLVVTRSAAAAREEQIADALVDSVTLGSGQLCTKPGLIFLPAGEEGDRMVRRLADRLSQHPGATLLNENISSAYDAADAARRLAWPGLATLEGQRPTTSCGVPARVVLGDADDLRDELLEECFGPFAVVVRWTNFDELRRSLLSLPGSLTFSVHAERSDDPEVTELLAIMRSRVGRFVYNGTPTGVHVSWAQHHGGPWPATNSQHTSVGPTAIRRFMTPVTWQNMPIDLVPAELRGNTAVPIRINGHLQSASRPV